MPSIRDLLRPILLGRMSYAERQKVAEELRAIGEEQAQIAEADRAIGHAYRRSVMEASSGKIGRPKGSGARWIRIEPPISTEKTWRLHVGRALWQELGEPRRLDLQKAGGALLLIPCGIGVGYAMSRPPNGMPRMSVGAETIGALSLSPGKYPGEIRGGRIEIEGL